LRRRDRLASVGSNALREGRTLYQVRFTDVPFVAYQLMYNLIGRRFDVYCGRAFALRVSCPYCFNVGRYQHTEVAASRVALWLQRSLSGKYARLLSTGLIVATCSRTLDVDHLRL
jgi:hypothetical protein